MYRLTRLVTIYSLEVTSDELTLVWANSPNNRKLWSLAIGSESVACSVGIYFKRLFLKSCPCQISVEKLFGFYDSCFSIYSVDDSIHPRFGVAKQVVIHLKQISTILFLMYFILFNFDLFNFKLLFFCE